MIFEDRVSAYPGRYIMTDENGGVSHVVLERDDEPVRPGTPLNAETFNEMLSGLHPAYESTEHPGCYYRILDEETEWINPPMMPDVEYRTAERYNGLPVYVKRLPFSDASVGENRAAKAAFKYGYTLVGYSAVCRDVGYAVVLPFHGQDGTLHAWAYIDTLQSQLMPETFPDVLAVIYSPGVTDFSPYEITVKYIKA